MAIITYPLNGIEYDASDAETYLCTRSSGVFSADEHFKASITDDREVTISTGLAWINNDAFAGKSVANTAPVAVSIPVSDGALDRIDRIVLRFDKAANASTIALIQGTPASAPVAPAVTQASTLYELGLYTVLVPAASTVVLASHITDTRADETVCGLMSDAVSKISTTKIVGPKYTISLEPDTADKAASVIRIKDNASGNTRVLIAANEDANNAENEVAQIVLRDGTNVGKVNIQCNTSGAKGIKITDNNNVERIKLHYTTTDDRCLFEIKNENGNDVTLSTIGAAASVSRLTPAGGGTVNITVEDNTEYRFTSAVELLNVGLPSGNFDCWMRFTCGTDPVVTFVGALGFIGGEPTFETDKTYEVSIKDGVVLCAEVASE